MYVRVVGREPVFVILTSHRTPIGFNGPLALEKFSLISWSVPWYQSAIVSPFSVIAGVAATENFTAGSASAFPAIAGAAALVARTALPSLAAIASAGSLVDSK